LGDVRRFIKLFAVGLLIVTLVAIMAHFGSRPKSVSISELQFPVLVLPADGSGVYVANDAESLTQVRMGAWYTPTNGSTVIDARFNFYAEQNVKCEQGEGGMLFRAFVRPGKPLTFSLDFEAKRESGLAAALDLVLRHANLGTAPTIIDDRRKQLAAATTMAQIVDVLNGPTVNNGMPPDAGEPTTETTEPDSGPN
jgi:hypothetical protein